MIRMMVGRDIKEVYKEKDYEIGDVVLSVKNLKRGRMVNDVSFEVHQGEILGFSGIVGAGRTETMRCIFGLDRAERGTVLLDGQPVRVREPHDAIHQGIMMVTEDRKKDGLVLIRSIYENMLLPSTYRKSNKGILNKKNESQDVDKYYKELEVKAPSINVITNQLSGGNQQKVIIAKWLMMNPKVLIMDEPTRGIDILRNPKPTGSCGSWQKKGVAIILVSSDMEEVLGVSDRIAVMCQGQITGFLDREEFDQERSWNTLQPSVRGITYDTSKRKWEDENEKEDRLRKTGSVLFKLRCILRTAHRISRSSSVYTELPDSQ